MVLGLRGFGSAFWVVLGVVLAGFGVLECSFRGSPWLFYNRGVP